MKCPLLVDTCVWIDHLHKPDKVLEDQLAAGNVFTHPMMIRELMMGNLPNREVTIDKLRDFQTLISIDKDDFIDEVEQYNLYARGINMVDANLLLSCKRFGAKIYTHDTKLNEVAAELGVKFNW